MILGASSSLFIWYIIGPSNRPSNVNFNQFQSVSSLQFALQSCLVSPEALAPYGISKKKPVLFQISQFAVSIRESLTFVAFESTDRPSLMCLFLHSLLPLFSNNKIAFTFKTLCKRGRLVPGRCAHGHRPLVSITAKPPHVHKRCPSTK